MELSNTPVLSVSQVSAQVKATIEDRFERVRIRGEVSRPTRARSGHFYVTLKDERAVIDAVAWKGVAARLPFDMTEGMEIIATGKLTTFPGNSKYQLVIETVELAGEGALLKMLEDRRRALMAEGLFDEARKQRLPALPRRIGVVSSPNGAVIRDIWHRVRDRFPLPVTLWPVIVQGQGAAAQVARAIQGFDAMGGPARPDLLIVARGGGSLEDLWAFNEEAVVRAAAACRIPLISAIGHETDTTLLDYVADRRAPTPTAAAEFAVPVRAELMAYMADQGTRLHRGVSALYANAVRGLRDVAQGLRDPLTLVQGQEQTLDMLTERLATSRNPLIERLHGSLRQAEAALGQPKVFLKAKANTLRDLEADARLSQALHRTMKQGSEQLRNAEAALGQSKTFLRAKAAPLRELDAHPRMAKALERTLSQGQEQVEAAFARLIAQDRARKAVQAQGWVTVQDGDGQTLTSAKQIVAGERYNLAFHDGEAAVLGAGEAPPPPALKRASKSTPPNSNQESLF